MTCRYYSHTHPTLCCSARTQPQPHEQKLGACLRAFDACTTENKGVHTKHETREDIPTQGDKPSTGCEGYLSLGKKYSRPKAPSYVTEWGQKTAGARLPFPTAGQFWLRAAPWGFFKCQLGLLSPEWGWRICFQGGSLKASQGGAGSWWGTSAPLHADSSAQRLDLSLGSWLPTERVIPEINVEASAALSDLAPEVPQCPFCSTPPPTATGPVSVTERTPQGPE